MWEVVENKGRPPTFEVYKEFISIIRKALGEYADPTHYIIKYPEFFYNVISLFGNKLFNLSMDEVDKVLRSVYSQITFVREGINYLKMKHNVMPVSGFENLKYFTSAKTEINRKEELFNMYRKCLKVVLFRIYIKYRLS